MNCRVVVVDDDKSGQHGWRLLLVRRGDMEVVGEADYGYEAIALAIM